MYNIIFIFQGYAFVRISVGGGRKTNLSASSLAHGMEKLNCKSSLSLPNDVTAHAHTRNRTVLRPVVEPHPSGKELESAPKATIWTGSKINLQNIHQSMEDATHDCIAEGKKMQFPVFLAEDNITERTGKRIRPTIVPFADYDSDDNEEDKPDEEPCAGEEGAVFEEVGDNKKDFITTKLFGKVHYQTAENILLNGGPTKFKAMSRQSRFTKDAFGISSDIKLYNKDPCFCPNVIRIGDIATLYTFEKEKKVVTGEVRFISYKSNPLRFYCSTHTKMDSSPNFRLLVQIKYVRCVL